jgi:hypothetical protein
MNNPYKIDRNQVGHEARAKILWGDPPEEVVHYLRVQGFSEEEAWEVVDAAFQERAATIRGMGIKKILLGSVLVALPFVTYSIFAGMPSITIRLVGLAAVAGLWGAWLLIKGITMLASPKSEPGDVADQ